MPANLLLPEVADDDDDDRDFRIAFAFDGTLADERAERVHRDGHLELLHGQELERSAIPHGVDPCGELIRFSGYKQSGYGMKGGKDYIDGFFYEKTLYLNGD